ncbi:MAG: ABC transporter permease subunit [Candidatus Cloacimonetes bacterium]|nr:ABC transporter permease subunit [Candidatus Cloacimonadota bacterium]
MLLQDVLITLGRVFVWSVLSWLLGLALAYPAAKAPGFRRMLLPVVNFFRHVSPYCWLPVVIIVAGTGELAVGLILLAAMLFTAIVMSIEIFSGIPRDILDQAALDGAHAGSLVRHIEIPLTIGELLNLFRILWSVAWTTVIAAEMLGVSSGVGYRLLDFRYLLMYPQMFFYILVTGALGIAVDILLLRFRRLILAC